MTKNEFLNHFEGVKGSNGQYSALCPAHHDNAPSLSIKEGEKGFALHCHAGCDTKDIVGAVGLTMNDLFYDSKLPKQQTSSRRGQIVTRYDYTDIDGNLLYRKTRWVNEDGKKTFTWSHMENGQWKSGRNGEPVLYNLPATKATGTIYVVEGEKDVDTLKAHHLAAVCGADGAGKDKWLPQYTEALKGKRVVVIQDNDDTGKKYAIATCNALHGQAASVKLVDLSVMWKEIPEHGDITDAVNSRLGESAMVSLEFLSKDLPEYRPQELPEILPEFFDGKRFLHHVLGDYLIKKFFVCKINGTVHIYDNGIYKQGEETLYGHMLELIPSLKDSQRNEVYKYIKVSLKTPVKEVSPPHLIPFSTQIYDLKENKFIEYSPQYVFLNRFPYDYKPDAPRQEKIIQTIQQIADGDEEVMKLLFEAMGNCFYLLNSYRGAVMLYGKNGSNGKSTLLNMISRLLGRDNASFLSMQDLSEKFRLIEVYGKAVNIGDDIPSTYIPDTSTFKKLVTGEYVTAEKKGKDPIQFKPFAKMFFAMNGLPSVSEKSKAFFGRILLIPLNKDFSNAENRDNSLKDYDWTQEDMEYLTRLAMDGLKRLLKQGDFTRPQVVKDAIAQYELENNPIKEFLHEYGSVDGKPTQEAYNDYTNWCCASGHKNRLSRYKFSREICAETGMKTANARHQFFGGKPGKCFVQRNVTDEV